VTVGGKEIVSIWKQKFDLKLKILFIIEFLEIHTLAVIKVEGKTKKNILFRMTSGESKQLIIILSKTITKRKIRNWRFVL
jgi:hypothetical protein